MCVLAPCLCAVSGLRGPPVSRSRLGPSLSPQCHRSPRSSPWSAGQASGCPSSPDAACLPPFSPWSAGPSRPDTACLPWSLRVKRCLLGSRRLLHGLCPAVPGAPRSVPPALGSALPAEESCPAPSPVLSSGRAPLRPAGCGRLGSFWPHALGGAAPTDQGPGLSASPGPGLGQTGLHGRFSRVRLVTTPRTVARQAPLSMGFSRQEHWSGLPCPPQGDLPDPGMEPRSPALQADSLPSEPSGKTVNIQLIQYSCIDE